MIKSIFLSVIAAGQFFVGSSQIPDHFSVDEMGTFMTFDSIKARNISAITSAYFENADPATPQFITRLFFDSTGLITHKYESFPNTNDFSDTAHFHFRNAYTYTSKQGFLIQQETIVERIMDQGKTSEQPKTTTEKIFNVGKEKVYDDAGKRLFYQFDDNGDCIEINNIFGNYSTTTRLKYKGRLLKHIETVYNLAIAPSRRDEYHFLYDHSQLQQIDILSKGLTASYKFSYNEHSLPLTRAMYVKDILVFTERYSYTFRK